MLYALSIWTLAALAVLLTVVLVTVGSGVVLAGAARRWVRVAEQESPPLTGGRAVADAVGTFIVVLGLLCWAAVGAAYAGLSVPPVRRWMLSGPPPLDQLGGGPFAFWSLLLLGVGGAVCLAAGLWTKADAWDPADPYGPD
ncbi:hypothetical protein RQM47_01430 [Rubrivirga sp. S365]|uniref:Integral membrane protein n=1 Tax=Rubrivirga litoralis TaxID=3075598 RepID=A0ABU3BRV2_9BACT|nr:MULTISPECIES: hypothetical protein [unclassified Rubrivirga]MDT0632013.1 hypothetical protein [Rubrivirga sp. F394]MDT7855294.1 hypothetical protein [Rubrivirga sp. S365]